MYNQDRLSLFYLEPQQYILLRLRAFAKDGSAGWLHICTRSIIFQPEDVRCLILRIKIYDETWLKYLTHVSPQQFKCIPEDKTQLNSFFSTIKKHNGGQHLSSVFLLSAHRLQKASRQPISAYDTIATSNCLVFSLNEPNEKIIEFIEIYDQLKKYLKHPDYKESLYLEYIVRTRLTNTYAQIITIEGIIVCSFKIQDHELRLKQIVNGYQTNSIPTKSIRHIVKYRYMQEHTALELFLFGNQHSILINFRQQDRETIYDRLHAVCKNLQRLSIESVQQRWCNKTISNFRYLQYLNTFASRSIHDASSYPIFPWLIHQNGVGFDVDNRTIFRDLSKSIGQLNPHRLRRLKQLSKQDPTLTNKVEPYCLFKTYLSTSSIVHYFLLRRHPEMIVRLQHSVVVPEQRIFYSIERAYYNSLNGVADFKELIPQFYEQPGVECLSNLHGLQLGSTKKQIDDAQIPEWADNCQDFIDKMQLALQSAYVSQRLHLWIDLIFGFKTLSENRRKYDNEYNPMCYEECIPKEKTQAIRLQIFQFGQHPPTLFKQPHIPRNKPSESLGSSIDDNLQEQLDSFLDD